MQTYHTLENGSHVVNQSPLLPLVNTICKSKYRTCTSQTHFGRELLQRGAFRENWSDDQLMCFATCCCYFYALCDLLLARLFFWLDITSPADWVRFTKLHAAGSNKMKLRITPSSKMWKITFPNFSISLKQQNISQKSGKIGFRKKVIQCEGERVCTWHFLNCSALNKT